MADDHKCLHEADWGSVKTNLVNICKDIKEIKEHSKTIAAMKVWIYVLWLAWVGFLIFDLRMHNLW